MPWLSCCAPGCTTTERQIKSGRYPFLKNCELYTFPSNRQSTCKLRNKWCKAIQFYGSEDRGTRFIPKRHARLCSRHFVDGKPTERYPVPVLFKSNGYSTKILPKEHTPVEYQGKRQKKTREIDEHAAYHYPVEPAMSCEVIIPSETEKSMTSISSGINGMDFFASFQEAPSVDHTYSCTSSTESTSVEMNNQTDLTMGMIAKMENTIKEQNDQQKETHQSFRDSFLEKVLEDDDSVHRYTGLQNEQLLRGIYEMIPAGELRYWSAGHEKERKERKKPGPKRKIAPFHEFMICLIQLRLCLVRFLLADVFEVSPTRITQIVITWVHALHQVLSPLIIWPSQKQVRQTMPKCFKQKYPNTRVIIDCTEFRTEIPKSPTSHHQVYSQYKSSCTHKVLFGINPNGAFTFVSGVWGGNASDRFITSNCGILDLVEKGDDIMADRGFQIQDLLLPRGATLNMPPFTRNPKKEKGQGKRLNVSEVTKTRSIARLRIHVERAIQRVKTWRMLTGIIPATLKPIVPKVVDIVAVFCNFKPSLVK